MFRTTLASRSHIGGTIAMPVTKIIPSIEKMLKGPSLAEELTA